MSTKIIDAAAAAVTGYAFAVPTAHRNYTKSCTIDMVITGTATVQIMGSPNGDDWFPIGEPQRYTTSMVALLPAYVRADVSDVGEGASVDVYVRVPVTLVG